MIFLQAKNAVVRLNTGFQRFKTNIFEYVLTPKEICVCVQFGFLLSLICYLVVVIGTWQQESEAV
jgi:hypothetical protein